MYSILTKNGRGEILDDEIRGIYFRGDLDEINTFFSESNTNDLCAIFMGTAHQQTTDLRDPAFFSWLSSTLWAQQKEWSSSRQRHFNKELYDILCETFGKAAYESCIKIAYEEMVRQDSSWAGNDILNEFVMWAGLGNSPNLFHYFLDKNGTGSVQSALHALCELSKVEFVRIICLGDETRGPSGFCDDACFEEAASSANPKVLNFLLEHFSDRFLDPKADSGLIASVFNGQGATAKALLDHPIFTDERLLQDGSYALLFSGANTKNDATKIIFDEIKKRNLLKELSERLFSHEWQEPYLSSDSQKESDEYFWKRKGALFNLYFEDLHYFLPNNLPKEWEVFPNFKPFFEKKFIHSELSGDLRETNHHESTPHESKLAGRKL